MTSHETKCGQRWVLRNQAADTTMWPVVAAGVGGFVVGGVGGFCLGRRRRVSPEEEEEEEPVPSQQPCPVARQFLQALVEQVVAMYPAYEPGMLRSLLGRAEGQEEIAAVRAIAAREVSLPEYCTARGLPIPREDELPSAAVP